VSVLVVGAGAGGGYLGALLLAAGRDVTFLVHAGTLARLERDGLRIRHGDDVETLRVNAVTAAELNGPCDVIVLAVRSDAVASAIADMRPAVGPDTRIVPIVNGMRHFELLVDAFGRERVIAGATRLVASQLPDGTINVVVPGIQMEIASPVPELDVPNVEVTVRDDAVAAMWEKFAFITSTAVPSAESLWREAFWRKSPRSRRQRVIHSPTPFSRASMPFSPIKRRHSARRSIATWPRAARSRSAF
jgi:2-dehydropantoate 2-reductase